MFDIIAMGEAVIDLTYLGKSEDGKQLMSANQEEHQAICLRQPQNGVLRRR